MAGISNGELLLHKFVFVQSSEDHQEFFIIVKKTALPQDFAVHLIGTHSPAPEPASPCTPWAFDEKSGNTSDELTSSTLRLVHEQVMNKTFVGRDSSAALQIKPNPILASRHVPSAPAPAASGKKAAANSKGAAAGGGAAGTKRAAPSTPATQKYPHLPSSVI
ncbi:hypothetical protein T484DRAFT_1896732 [Baffinella frigidus]|nr:hypothetical protein T484DRAFT_1896732 [Cryptophyta sp. CCMP2293]